MDDAPQPLGRHNPKLKELRQLHQKRARQGAGLFLLEGTKLLAEALRSDWPLIAVYATEAWWGTHEDLTTPLSRGIPRYAVPGEVFDALSTHEAPEGVIALAPIPPPVALPAVGPETLFVALEGIQDPGNLGTLIRTAEAAGASGLLLGPGTAEPWSPKAVRASMGSVFRVPILERRDLAPVLAELCAAGVRLLAAEVGGQDLYATDLRGPVAWIMGSESHGVPADLRAMADGTVAIPMAGRVESLNAAIAAAICLFETRRQRRSGSGGI